MSAAPQVAPAAPMPAGLPRPADVVLVLLALPIAVPLFAAAALLLTVASGGTPLFRQDRMGRGGRPFVLLKLRTMRVGPRGSRVTASGDPRITRLGRWLRATKLDELPELWNVLRGDMALVGPRPEVPGLVDLADPLWRAVLQARPGLTDPITLRLRNEEQLLAAAGEDCEQFYRTTLQPFKLRGYVEYLTTRTWASDGLVLLRTALAIVAPHRVPPPSLQELESYRR